MPIANGGFETGDFSGWTTGGAVQVIGSMNLTQGGVSIPTTVNSGSHAAALGNIDPNQPFINGEAYIYQQFTVPTDPSQQGLQWSYLLYADSNSSYQDYQALYIRDGSGNVLSIPFLAQETTGRATAYWTTLTRSLAHWAGQTIQVYFSVTQHYEQTFMLIDDVSLVAAPTVVAPTWNRGFVNQNNTDHNYEEVGWEPPGDPNDGISYHMDTGGDAYIAWDIYRSSDGGATFTKVANHIPGEPSPTKGGTYIAYEDLSVTDSNWYVHYIVGVNSVGNTGQSQVWYGNTIGVGSVYAIQPYGGPSVVHMWWTPMPASIVTSYQIYRSTDGGHTYSYLTTVPALPNTYNDTAVVNQTTYNYKFFSVYTDGTNNNGYYSTSGPATPHNLLIITPSLAQITVGQSQQFTATVNGRDVTATSNWTDNNAQIASSAGSGLFVTRGQTGNTTITANDTADGASGTATLTVTSGPALGGQQGWVVGSIHL